MTAFNVLDRSESMHRHMLLEASAGTGKTFAIENIVVRLLLEPKGDEEPLLIENILVVTFTKIASRELKERIRSNLEKSLAFLKANLSGEDVRGRCPDYLLAHIETGEEAVEKARRAIECALFSFDKSQIFTIHGFCWRMLKNYALEAEIGLEAGSMEDQSLSMTKQLQVVRDFLRRELLPDVYSPGQLKIIQKRFKNDAEKLQKDLLIAVNCGIDIESTPPFSELLVDFQDRMKRLKNNFGLSRAQIIEDFYALAPFYTKLADRKGKIHTENIYKAERFGELFDKDEWSGEDLDALVEEGIFLLDCFSESLWGADVKKGKTSLPTNVKLLDILREHLEPVVSRAGNEASIFSRLACDCQKFVRSYLEQEEMFGHNDLLVQMRKAIDKPVFANRVRANYAAAIVDEFQDTDPVQWEIFSQLFVPANQEWKGRLHLVGDPKQSIYAFRQADIYTYLDAANRLGADSISTLGTNFRSRSSLIDALNILFNSAVEMFVLPRKSGSLLYSDVKAGRPDVVSQSCDKPSLHFWKVKFERYKGKIPQNKIQDNYLFPAIVKEILRLNEQEGVRFGQFAILVSTHHQASEICEFLREHDIPVKNQRGADFTLSHAVAEMRDLLNGVLNYSNRSPLNVALAGRLIGMTHRELQLLEDEEVLFRFAKQLDGLKSILNQSGFSAFFSTFMRSSWRADGKTVLDKLLRETDGLQFLREWQDLADLLIAEEQSGNLLPYGVVAFLDELEELSKNDDERIKVYLDPDEDGVSVMTMHVSKGLEFDIVIPLGLISEREQKLKDLIAIEKQDGFCLCSVEDENDSRYRKFCEEIDAEKMRQLYVAMTRAKDRMYVPFVIDEKQDKVDIGSASPMALFMARLGRPATDYAGLYARIASEDGSSLSQIVAMNPTKFSLEILQEQLTPLAKRNPGAVPLLKAPGRVRIPSQVQAVQSFTSLAHTKKHMFQDSENILSAPHNFDSEERTEHTLPSGSDTGILLHTIFENLPFDAVGELTSPKQLNALIAPFLKGTPFVLWEEAIAKIVFKSLKTDLGHGFCMSEISPKKIYRETEFLYPCDPKSSKMKDTQAMPGYLKGVVDVFFEHGGKYYLLDWKSNWLGPNLEHYQGKYLEEAMKSNNYDLQAAIYREAIERYLKVFDKRPFEEIFGGVYYLFVRGVDVDSGIYTLGVK